MSSIAVTASASGAGVITLQAPITATNRTITLPDATGTLVTEQAGNTVYKQSNVLGTVSQSAGVPTGAVIESGSNANGRYVKFADGTMICTASFVGWVGGQVSVVKALPAAFVSAPAATWNSVPSENIYMVSAVWCDTTTWSFRHATASTVQTYWLTATGRWF